MKNIKKIMIILLLVTIFICLNTVIFGVDNPDAYTPETMSDKDSEKIGNITGDILATIRAVGAIGAIVILSIIGLKYIFSSVEEKAEYKQTIAPYVIGCVLLVSATTIPSMVYDFVDPVTVAPSVEKPIGARCIQCNKEVRITATGGYTSFADGSVKCEECSNKSSANYKDSCSICGKDVFTSDERHEKLCKSCKNNGK